MIPIKELQKMSIEQGVPLVNIEKDYVMGWLLWGIYNNYRLSQNLVLKGGNCLRKIYFSDTRFSDDLDFTAFRLDNEEEFHFALDSVCKEVKKASGIEFDLTQTRVKLKDTPDAESHALDGRVYFHGLTGNSSVTMRVKFDVSEYEKIVLPLQSHQTIHNYSDVQAIEDVLVKTYSLEEVLAEKLRSWIQRTRPRDLFDVVKIIQSKAVPISKRNILSAFFQKTIFKRLPLAGKDEMLYEPKFKVIENSWLDAIICPLSAVIVVADAIVLFKDFISALFDPNLLQQMGFSTANVDRYSYNILSGIRETIIEAGKARKLIRMHYNNRDRDIEPYSFRYRVTQKGYAAEYFYGFDRTKDQTIKSFFLHQIQGVSILPKEYIPRWYVEF